MPKKLNIFSLKIHKGAGIENSKKKKKKKKIGKRQNFSK